MEVWKITTTNARFNSQSYRQEALNLTDIARQKLRVALGEMLKDPNRSPTERQEIEQKLEVLRDMYKADARTLTSMERRQRAEDLRLLLTSARFGPAERAVVEENMRMLNDIEAGHLWGDERGYRANGNGSDEPMR